MSPGVVMPADAGRVFFMCRNEGERAFSIRTKVWPPKYICVPCATRQSGFNYDFRGIRT